MAADVEPEDVSGVAAHLGGVAGHLDTPGLASPAHVHLGLDDHGVADALGRGSRLVGGERHLAGEVGNPKEAKNSLP